MKKKLPRRPQQVAFDVGYMRCPEMAAIIAGLKVPHIHQYTAIVQFAPAPPRPKSELALSKSTYTMAQCELTAKVSTFGFNQYYGKLQSCSFPSFRAARRQSYLPSGSSSSFPLVPLSPSFSRLLRLILLFFYSSVLLFFSSPVLLFFFFFFALFVFHTSITSPYPWLLWFPFGRFLSLRRRTH